MNRRPITDPAWATKVRTFPGDAGCFEGVIPFGPVRWDSTRAAVEIRQYWGTRVLGRGTDPVNRWRNGRPQGALNIQDAGPDELRAAAAALINAAEIIEGAAKR